ncbi:MAG: hypothetical protein HYX52_07900 [Chloroflexi bacterium]|nr:hypothetical protein [Chloroflexota bacterium]
MPQRTSRDAATVAEIQPAVDAPRSHEGEPTIVPASLYQRLAAPFDSTFRDVRGGVELEYITGEQCVSRLNETLGVENWSFRISEHGINVEADEAWVLGEMTAQVTDRCIVRQQFGSQKLKRSRASGQPLDIGFDLKGAATDALKKCASLVGVGLYLSRKESAPAPVSGPRLAQPVREQEDGAASSHGQYACADCGTELKETRFKDGTVWGPGQLASYGQRKHGKVLCMDHYRVANELRKSQLLTA